MKYILRRRRPASAPRMTISSRTSWRWKGLGVLVLLGLAFAIAVAAYWKGRNYAGFDPVATMQQLTILTQQVQSLQRERDQLRSNANATESAMHIERSTQQQLASQIKELEAENGKLKEDLAFFESMLPTGTGPKDVAIQRLEGELLAPNRLRYRLLVRQGVRDHHFSGTLQLAITVLQHGASTVLMFPSHDGVDADKYKLEFKYYQRVEGVLSVPEGAVIKAIQARVLENGKVRTQQSANL
jgi:hypothetical protein